MITVLARFHVRPGAQPIAEEAFQEMAAAVAANEPGTLAYLIHWTERVPTELTILEMYEDEEALAAHGHTPHMKRLQERLGKHVDLASLKMERLNRIAGFIRRPQ